MDRYIVTPLAGVIGVILHEQRAQVKSLPRSNSLMNIGVAFRDDLQGGFAFLVPVRPCDIDLNFAGRWGQPLRGCCSNGSVKKIADFFRAGGSP